MGLLAFVERGVVPAAQCRILEPVEHEQGSLDLADFLEGDTVFKRERVFEASFGALEQILAHLECSRVSGL